MTDAAAPQVREAGDSALLLELPGTIDPGINARAIGIARSLREEAIPGILDVVSTYRSVGIYFDPLRTNVDVVQQALRRSCDDAATNVNRPTIEVPVLYGGDAGPDLNEVAQYAGLSPEAVVTLHSSTTYRVYMLGFLPGFAYMGSVPTPIASPRRSSPRTRVPGGSVGIAGAQTGIYPRESPGGWQLIGRTPMRVFDPSRSVPALFSPGDHVRFVSTARTSIENPFPQTGVSDTIAAPQSLSRAVTVLQPGLLTTIQDGGRWGHQGSGVPVSGPMDRASHRLANVLVGNPADAAALEATLIGPQLRMHQATVIAITGGDLRPTLDGMDIPLAQPILCRTGTTLAFSGRRSGARAYIAFDGGVDVPPLLGSRATHVTTAMGGVGGRSLRARDAVPLGMPGARPLRSRSAEMMPAPDGGARVRVMCGPQQEFFDSAAVDILQRTRFVISAQSDRMGYRLHASTPIPRRPGMEMISDVTFMGSIQVPPSGDPIMLMADRPTTGGYPQIATVITADLPLAGQLAPGDWIEFTVCSRAEALRALVAQENKLLAIA